MNYEALWKLMADLVAELRESGESVPADVMQDLRSAKTMIEILKVDRSRSENLVRIEEYLNKFESYLVLAAERRFRSIDRSMIGKTRSIETGSKKVRNWRHESAATANVRP